MTVLRVAVNLLFLRPGRVGGSEVYCREILTELASRGDARLQIIGTRAMVESLGRFPADFEIFDLGWPYGPKRILAEQVGVCLAARRYRAGVLWSPGNFGPVFQDRMLPQVITVYDLQHKHIPEHFSLSTRIARTILMRLSLHHATHIIAISRFTAEDLVQRLGVSANKVTVVHLGSPRHAVPNDSDVGQALERHGVRKPYFYYPATLAPHKNHAVVIDALAAAARLMPVPDLVLTGDPSTRMGALNRIVRTAGMEGKVRHLGYVGREDVLRLTRGATAMVFPSQFEGFGLPLVEAMAMGTPVIASEAAAIPEVVGDAALLVNPLDVQAWVEAICLVTSDDATRTRLVNRGEVRAKAFDWGTCADATHRVLSEAGSAAS